MDMDACYLLNFGYQGCMSTIEALVDRNDVIVYDSESHACMVDGVRLHQGKRKVFLHNDMESFEKQMTVATKIATQTGGGILVVTEGVFGMSGDQGKLKEIIDYRKSGKFNFRIFVDDAHGFGTLGEKGQGAGEEQGVQDEIDVLFGTFAKSMASVGAFVCSTDDVINYLAYNMRSQIFAKSLPMPLVVGGLKRLELLKAKEQKDKQCKDERKIGAAFGANIAADHICNKLIHHFCGALHPPGNKLTLTHGRDQKNAADRNCQKHEEAGIGEGNIIAARVKLDKRPDFKLLYG